MAGWWTLWPLATSCYVTDQHVSPESAGIQTPCLIQMGGDHERNACLEFISPVHAATSTVNILAAEKSGHDPTARDGSV